MNEFLAGAVSGFSQTIVGHPLDTIKVRIQNGVSTKGLKPSHYYRGVAYPLVSASIINSILFGTYHNSLQYTDNKWASGFLAGLAGSPVVYAFDLYKTKRQMNYPVTLQTFLKSRGIYACMARECLAFTLYFAPYDYLREAGFSSMVAGSVAGVNNWLFSYPIDVIRNRQMSEGLTFKEAYQRGNLWKGLSVCMVRAVIVNAVGFYVYEEAYKKLKDKKE